MRSGGEQVTGVSYECVWVGAPYYGVTLGAHIYPLRANTNLRGGKSFIKKKLLICWAMVIDAPNIDHGSRKQMKEGTQGHK